MFRWLVALAAGMAVVGGSGCTAGDGNPDSSGPSVSSSTPAAAAASQAPPASRPPEPEIDPNALSEGPSGLAVDSPGAVWAQSLVGERPEVLLCLHDSMGVRWLDLSDRAQDPSWPDLATQLELDRMTEACRMAGPSVFPISEPVADAIVRGTLERAGVPIDDAIVTCATVGLRRVVPGLLEGTRDVEALTATEEHGVVEVMAACELGRQP